MKFVINTNYKDSAGTNVLNGIEKRLRQSGYDVSIDDWDNYGRHDVAIFMAPDSKIREAKKLNPRIFCVLFDPKVTLSWQIKEVKSADLLIVSSVEQRDYLLKYNESIFIYYMFPDVPEIKKEHTQKEKIIVGYVGNKQHLSSMKDVSCVLDELSKKHQIEFWAIYNIRKLGRWTKNVPKVCSVKHIQWSRENESDDLSKCDIGIVPSVLPTSGFFTKPIRSFFYNPEGYHDNDYVLRFKFSNNPGRIYVFSQLHIPVVTDFTPSACQIIKDGESGFLVGTKEGWKNALENLVVDHELRQSLGQSLKTYLDKEYSIDSTFNKFLSRLNSLYANKQ